ncbi:flavin reductase family protein [Rhizobium sp. C4]|uniref:flavin reductase family protein n=1 Tax=Rhizobium sp. C4 TaxID=1349800 RepID=UPI001E65BC67|nr:flavin reductase family protein [Rhizobium sp. C4]MCD2173659.1 flavin reductase family protein [Rhizobium sp. C4]
MSIPLIDTAETSPRASFDMRELRDCFGAFYTGVTVVTTRDDEGRIYGTTVNSFSSLSLDPPLILWSQRRVSSTFPIFSAARYFAVNILAEDQVEISQAFSSTRPDKFAGIRTQPGLGGAPLILGCSAYLQCSNEMSYPGGDHEIFVGRVEQIETMQRPPLIFGAGRYRTSQLLQAGAGR